jgi:hypothetical protein
MRVVDPAGAERALAAGRLRCPPCGGRLRPWGSARIRAIRVAGAPPVSVRPRRGRCVACGMTHVLVPVWMLARRADAAPVVWWALAAHARGLGYRRIAQRLRRPQTTVRGWLRAFRSSAPALLSAFGPAVTRPAAGRVPAVLAVVRAIERAARSVPAWRVSVLVSGSLLVCNTNQPHVSGSSQLAR